MDSALMAELEPAPFEASPDTGAVPTSELSECTCPDFCERDHANE